MGERRATVVRGDASPTARGAQRASTHGDLVDDVVADLVVLNLAALAHADGCCRDWLGGKGGWGGLLVRVGERGWWLGGNDRPPAPASSSAAQGPPFRPARRSTTTLTSVLQLIDSLTSAAGPALPLAQMQGPTGVAACAGARPLPDEVSEDRASASSSAPALRQRARKPAASPEVPAAPRRQAHAADGRRRRPSPDISTPTCVVFSVRARCAQTARPAQEGAIVEPHLHLWPSRPLARLALHARGPTSTSRRRAPAGRGRSPAAPGSASRPRARCPRARGARPSRPTRARRSPWRRRRRRRRA